MGPRILVVGGLDVPRVHFPDPLAFPWSGEFLSGLIGGDIALVTGIEVQRRAATLLNNGNLDVVATSMNAALSALRPFEDQGGRLLFGTGSGYIDQYDPMSEHLLLEDAGLSFATRLAALTSEPSIRFGFDYLGAVEPGMVADLVLVDGDPEGSRTFLVPAGAAECGVESPAFESVEQSSGLQAVSRSAGLGRLLHSTLVDRILNGSNQKCVPALLDSAVAKFDDFLEIVTGVDVKDREREWGGSKRLLGESKQDYRVLAG
jgi:hypothetical protein